MAFGITETLGEQRPITDKDPDGQTRSELTSRDLYVSGTPKDGEEVWFDFIEPSKGKKIVVWLHFKHKDV